MMYNYLFLSLAMGITLSSATSEVSLAALVNQNSKQYTINSNSAYFSLLANNSATEISSSKAQAEDYNYLGLMNAGYLANQKRDYLTALQYFQQALTLQPGDSKAETAIRGISRHGFELYMQTGYAADRVRDYTTALQNFQKALQIRPDSWYAKQAVSNVTQYLAQQPTTPSEDSRGSSFSLWFMLVGIGVASGLSAILLFYLFKTTGSSLQEPELENSDLTEAVISESELIESFDERQEAAETANFDSKTTPSSTEGTLSSATESHNSDSTSIVPSGKSLAKLDIVPELIQDLRESDRGMRRKAVWELAQRGDSRAMKPLVELMIEVDSQERGLILEAMTQIAGRTLKPMNKAIMMSLQDENTQVKQNAIRDLTRVYELMTQVTKRLSQAVEDSDTQVQETAKWALKKLNQMPATSAWQVDNLENEVNNLESSNGNNINSNIHNGTNGTNKNSEGKYPWN